MPDIDPDLALVKALQAGDDHALSVLMDRHQQRLFHFILRHVDNPTDALELAQETFVRAYFNIQRFRPTALFSTWLHQIALNLCRDHVRSKQWKNRQKTDSFSPPAGGQQPELRATEFSVKQASPDLQLQRDEQMANLQKALEKLPLELKGPLLLTSVDGLSHQEAAASLGLSTKAVEAKVYRARKALKKMLPLLD